MNDARYLLTAMVTNPENGLRACVTVSNCQRLTDEQRLALHCRIEKALEEALCLDDVTAPLAALEALASAQKRKGRLMGEVRS